MRLSPQRLIIPLLVSFSLTGAGVVLIYFINKKKDEEEQRIKNKKTEQHSVEIQIPRQFVPAIIGRGGSVIQNIQDSTGTNISFKEENDVDLPERTCVITGSHENIQLAEEKIICIIHNQPLIETYEKWVSQQTINRIKERGSEELNKIQNSSNAKIILDNSSPLTDSKAKKRVTIKGTAEQIACALIQIEDKEREDNEIRVKTDKNIFSRVPRIKTSPATSTVTSPESTAKDISYSKEVLTNQTNEGLMDVFVSAMENPSQFYIQMIGPTNDKLDNLIKKMTAYYENEENRKLHALHTISVWQMVAAKFPIDDKWYRAEILADLGDHLYDVYFVDFGDREKIDSKDICELNTEFLSLRLQAIECSLSGVKPKEGEWSLEACEEFVKLSAAATWHPRVAKIRGYKERVTSSGPSRREGSPIPCVELYQKDDDDQLINIGKKLISLKLAIPESEPWSAASSTLSLSKRSQDLRATSPEASRTANGVSNGSSKPIEEIDLTLTPHSKAPKNVEVIDLTSPAKDSKTESSRSFIENERSTPTMRNGSGAANQSKNRRLPANPFQPAKKPITYNIMPAGYESELSDEDEFDYN